MAVTRKDVAERAGLSTAVVSYVLNDGPRAVSAAARAKVLAAVDELGYRPDGVARMLAGGRSRSVGLVVPDVSMPYFGAAAQEISREATRRGYQLMVATTDWDLDTEARQVEAIAERRVEAVLLMSVDPSEAEERWAALGTPVVVVDRPGLAVDGSAAVTRHLLEHGHRRVGFIGGPAELTISARREQGWRRALREAGLRPAGSRIVRGPVTERGGHAAVDALLAAPARCTALFAETDVQAVGALRRLRERGLQVPEDVAVATLDSTELAEFSVPPVTAVVQPHRNLGPSSLDVALAPGSAGVLRLDVTGFTLAARASCGCAPA